MNDSISRRAAIDALKKAYWDKNIQSTRKDPCVVDAMTDWAIRQVKALPPTEPERKKGKWIKHEHGYWTFVNKNGERDGWTPYYECSLCGSEGWQHIESLNFCPWCGADMRGEEE